MGCRDAPRFTATTPCFAEDPPRDRDPRAPAQALPGAARRHRWRGGSRGRRPPRPARRSSRPTPPPPRPQRCPRLRPSRCRPRRPRPSGPRWPRPCAVARSRTGRCRCWPASPSGPTRTRPPSSRRPPARATRWSLGEQVYGGCASCHGADRRWRRGSRPHRRARDLARLPRPRDVGAPGIHRRGRVTPTAPTDKPKAGGMPRPRRAVRRRAGTGRPLRAGHLRRPRPHQRGVPRARRDRRGPQHLRRGRPRRAFDGSRGRRSVPRRELTIPGSGASTRQTGLREARLGARRSRLASGLATAERHM